MSVCFLELPIIYDDDCNISNLIIVLYRRIFDKS